MVMDPGGDGTMPASLKDSGLLHDLLFQGQRSGRTALVSPEHDLELSYADLCRHSRALAELLGRRTAALCPRIALLLPACAEFVIALFAISLAGGVAIPLDIYTKPQELLAILRFLDPELVITNASLQRRIRAADAAWCVVEFDKAGLRTAFSGEVPTGSGSDPAPVADPEQDAVLILTSGTTGHPKAVRLSHRAIRRNVAMHLESLALGGEIISLQVLPLNYSYGLVACFLSTLSLQGTTILTPHALEPKLIHALVERYGANLLMGSPLIFQYLLENGGDDRRALRTLRYLTVGGDRCAPSQANLIQRCLPWASTYITYGLTEAGPRVSTLAPEFFASMPQSVGRALPGVEIAVMDPTGRPSQPGETGEVAVRTPSLMNGYFRDEVKTSEKVREGWLWTGDLGRLDGDGFLYLLGRRDREFKFRGRRVHPGYIEQIIFTHPDVQEVHVTRAEGAEGEYLCATLKTHAGSEERLVQELRLLCRQHLPAFLAPHEYRFYDRDIYHFKGKPATQAGSPQREA
jgi:long-chain acyl-CoA synthetase